MTAETVDLSPLRARGLLSHCGLTEAAPERVVEMTVERIECDRHELARLRAANADLVKAAQEPGRRGLRARLKTAETELAQAKWPDSRPRSYGHALRRIVTVIVAPTAASFVPRSPYRGCARTQTPT